MRLGESLKQAERRLRAARLHYGHGTDNARDEAAFLVLRGLGLAFDADPALVLKGSQVRRIESLIRERVEKRIPAAYLLHEAWLDGHAFYIDRRVIVPRSHIAGLLAARLHPWLRRAPQRVLDLCTGSGCLAILAALAYPRAEVHGSDAYADALAVAHRNVTRYRLQRRVNLIRSDLFNALQKNRYDLVLANPPYVPTRALRSLPPEYRYEPGIALAGGGSGLDFVARILADAPRYLRSGGILVCEVGDGRRTVERAYPRLPLLWPREEVFIAARAALSSRTSRAASLPARSTRARGHR